MADQVALEANLEERGFLRVQPEGSPAELRWYHHPASWRERLPMVRGYRRTVVVIDLPVGSPARADALFDELARLTAEDLSQRLAEATRPPLPWWGYPVIGLALVVAVVLTYFVGISIELRDQDWLLVVFCGDRLDTAAVAAVADQVAAGPGFTALGGVWDGVHDTLLLPATSVAALGEHRADALASRKDLRASLGSQLRVEPLKGSA